MRHRSRAGAVAAAHGFTIVELLIVVAVIAIASSVAVLAFRDPSATQLEREAARLGALLESARAEARAAGVVVRWVPGGEAGGFRFVGLPASLDMPTNWLGEGVNAEVLTEYGPAAAALLGPEPVIGAQRILLRVDSQMLMLATDGLGPFAVTPAEEETRAAR
jgi:general secretion pathway protein H